jgi:subtilisin family serine protease
MFKSWKLVRGVAGALALSSLLFGCSSDPPEGGRPEQQGQALEVVSTTGTEIETVLVLMRQQADLTPALAIKDWKARGQEVVQRLTTTAQGSQASVLGTLATTSATTKSFWIVNAIQVTADKATIAAIANDPAVAGVYPDQVYEVPPVLPGSTEPTINAVEWGINAVRAPEVWQTYGARGEGIVVANIDTGVQFDHPALSRQYRGNQSGVIDHNYNWFDPANICPVGLPCDNNNHGTHTMGTMVGEDAALTNQIGVAPRARWIAAKGCEQNTCSRTSLLAAGQWILAPTDLSGNNPRPDLRPNIVNNSWGGAGDDPWYRGTVQAWVASGIFPSFSNGNSGPSCSSAGTPGDYDESYGVGAFASNGTIASFSSRGPGFGGNMKPNISAPGVNVRSSIAGNSYASLQGTSMAAPHVSGVVALMWSAAPSLVGDIELTRTLLNQTAIDTNDTTCGGTAQNNNVWGEGKMDGFAAVTLSPRGPTGILAGLVRATAGEPIAGAQVNVTGPSARSTVTNASGNFTMTLPVGDYDVTASSYGYLPTTLEDQPLLEGGTTNVEVVLDAAPSFALSGTVSNGTQPFAGATVALAGSPFSTTTDAAGNYSFSNVFVGDYTLSVTVSDRCLLGDSRALTISENTVQNFSLQTRRDAFGYGCRSIPFAYVDGTTALPLTGDDASVAVPLPFTFPFYGGNYGTAFVSTNGQVNFAASSTVFSNTSIPNTALPNLAVYAFWDDLLVDASSSILTGTIGTAPNRTFVIEYRNVAFTTTLRIDFEILLDEDGGIRFQYRGLDNTTEQAISATVGLENATGTVAYQYSFNEAVLRSNLALEFGLAFDDAEPPSVALTAPIEGAVLAGLVGLTADAADNVGVERVDFYADRGTPAELLIGSDATAPYAVDWNTMLAAQGARQLSARAFDEAGNLTDSAVVNVTLDNPPDTTPPTVAITAPEDGALVGGDVIITADASDDVAVAAVDFVVDGITVGTDTTAPYEFVWDSSPTSDGPHELLAIATDPFDNSTTSELVVVTTDNTGPALTLDTPLPGTLLSGTAELAATASDTSGIDRVDFLIDGVELGSDTTAPYSFSWNTAASPDGTHDVLAIAVDALGNDVAVAAEVSSDNSGPTVAITSPAPGAAVSGIVNLTASASDTPAGVAQVQFLVDGVALSTDTSAPYAATWDATAATPGAHGLTAIATDVAGNARTSAVVSVNVPQPFQYYWFEAEAGAPTAPLRTPNDAAASGGRFLDATPGNNSSASPPANGRATYTFNVTSAGTFRVWGRTIAPNDSDDSFWVQVDNGTWQRWNFIARSTTWTWDEVHHENNGAITALTFSLPIGTHRVTVAYREDGTRLDRLLVTNDMSFVPTGMGPGAAPQAPTGLAAVAGAGQISLTWATTANATSYVVRRGASGGPYTQVATPTGANHIDSGLTNGQQYCYVVAAANADGVSANSAQVCATPNGCSSDAQCNDNLYCNGTETCVQGSCQPGTAPSCNDNVSCTVDSCNEANDNCSYAANDAACSDGLFCTGGEVCNVTTGCQPGSDPCQGQSCNEANDTCGNSCSSNAQCDDGQFCNGQETCGGGACLPGQDQGAGCYNARPLARNQQSGSFGTTGEVWFVITDNPVGWQASEVQGRTITVNGVQVTAGQMPLPPAIGGKRYFRFSAGSRTWASWSFW